MKDWKRGRKPLPPKQKQEALNWQRERVKIANLVARKPEIQKICCICGNPGHILHNRHDPYYITFICNECEQDPNNLIIAEESRFDVRTKLDKSSLSVKNYNQQEMIRIVVGYMNDTLSLGDYCSQLGLTRYQFNQMIDAYDKLFPKQNIHQLITNRSNKIQKQKCVKRVEQRLLK